MSAPNPAPYYRYYRQRSITGPLVIIALGVVFLLHNIGVLHAATFWIWLGRWWPVVLIALGLVKLVEYMWARQTGAPAPRVGAGLVVLVLFLIFLGTATRHLSDVNWHGVRGQITADDPEFGDFIDGLWGNSYEFTDNFASPVAKGSQVKIIAYRGDITVKASPDDQAHAIVRKKIRSDSQDSANRLDQSTQPKLSQQGGILLLDLSGGDYQRGSFDLDLELPRQTSLSINNHVGDIVVDQRDANVQISTDRGDINLTGIKGDATVQARGRSSFTARNIAGNVSLDGTISDSDISDVSGTVTMSGTFLGDMQLARIAKQVHFTSSRTDLQFARLDGAFTMAVDDLRASSITGPFKIDTRSKGIHLEDVTGPVQINNRNATVEVSPKAPLGPIDITNVHGEVDLTLPPTAGFQLNAESMGGEIESDFNINLDNSHNNATATGTVGRGGPEVRLRADHGTIQIRKQ
ncbi:MAG TPA: DUF4097 family beta strand repeat-containing protein [Terriglobales bacterium]|nr:DUF4097 family beta strand repeat-containing protein [Terriglobales bacterium]